MAWKVSTHYLAHGSPNSMLRMAGPQWVKALRLKERYWHLKKQCCSYIWISLLGSPITFTKSALLIAWGLSGTKSWLNTFFFRPRQDGCHFPDGIFICIFFNENEWHSIKISLKFVRKVPINNIPALVQIMAWRWPGDKPLSEPMLVSSLTHICVTRPQWVNTPTAGRCSCKLKTIDFQTHINYRYFEQFKWNCPEVNATKASLIIGHQQAITWKNAEFWLHMVSLGHNGLN